MEKISCCIINSLELQSKLTNMLSFVSSYIYIIQALIYQLHWKQVQLKIWTSLMWKYEHIKQLTWKSQKSPLIQKPNFMIQYYIWLSHSWRWSSLVQV